MASSFSRSFLHESDTLIAVRFALISFVNGHDSMGGPAWVEVDCLNWVGRVILYDKAVAGSLVSTSQDYWRNDISLD